MLYTIAEISNLIGLSKVSIYKKLKLKEMEIHISKKRGITYVSEQGFNLIKDNLKVNPNDLNGSNNTTKSIPLDDYTATDTEDLNLKDDYIATLKDQLKVKDSQIHDLHKLIENNQVLLKEKPKQDIFLLEEHFNDLDVKLEEVRNKMSDRKEQQKQRSFFSKIFKGND